MAQFFIFNWILSRYVNIWFALPRVLRMLMYVSRRKCWKRKSSIRPSRKGYEVNTHQTLQCLQVSRKCLMQSCSLEFMLFMKSSVLARIHGWWPRREMPDFLKNPSISLLAGIMCPALCFMFEFRSFSLKQLGKTGEFYALEMIVQRPNNIILLFPWTLIFHSATCSKIWLFDNHFIQHVIIFRALPTASPSFCGFFFLLFSLVVFYIIYQNSSSSWYFWNISHQHFHHNSFYSIYGLSRYPSIANRERNILRDML